MFWIISQVGRVSGPARDVHAPHVDRSRDIVNQTCCWAVDEEEGIVVLWMNFGDTNSYGAGNRILPKETQRGWPSTE